LSGVVAIAAGWSHTVALKQNGSVVAWGGNWSGQTSVPAGLSGVVAIAAAGSHTVALKQDGSVVAWGSNHEGQTSVPAALSGVMAIAAGASHTLALKRDQRDFGVINVGSIGPAIPVTLRNSGDANLSIKSIVLVGGQTTDFRLDKVGTATTLSAGSNTTLRLSFQPKALGIR
jgi:Regulator of chromosome condensation (RCC1) repeat